MTDQAKVLREQAAILLAAAEGKKIEQRHGFDNHWGTRNFVDNGWVRKQGGTFNFDLYEYRIVPEPLKELWVCLPRSSADPQAFFLYDTALVWSETHGNYYPPIRMVEARNEADK